MIYKELLDAIFLENHAVTAEIYLKEPKKGAFHYHHNEFITIWNRESDYGEFKVIHLEIVSNDCFKVCLEEEEKWKLKKRFAS